MNIVYSSSDSYAWLTGISLLSLMENNKSAPQIVAYIIDNKISLENKEKLEKVANDYHRELYFIPMPDIESIIGYKIDVKSWNISTFGKLFVTHVLPDSVEKALYIDCDTIIVQDISELWHVDLKNAVVAGVRECFSDNYKQNVGLHRDSIYLNAGVSLFNLKLIREKRIDLWFLDFIKKYQGCLHYLDQDVLNGTLEDQDKQVLPPKFNSYSLFHYLSYPEIKKYRIRASRCFYTESEIIEAADNPVIIHFTASFLDGTRPWIVGNKHPLRKKFIYYKEISPWADAELWPDHRNKTIKIGHGVYQTIPKNIACFLVSWLHGVFVPKLHGIRTHHALRE